MRKLLFSLVLLITVSFAANAQSGTNKIGIGAEAAIPIGNAKDVLKTGFGGSLKALFGIGKAGQVTLTSGYTTFSGKDIPDGYKATLSVIPALAGYRQNIAGFYIEPQAGASLISEKDSYDGESETGSTIKFTWGVGAGYVISNVEIGARYQRAEVEGGNFSFAGLKLGYNF